MLQAYQPLEMVLQVAVPGMAGTKVEENLAITCDGEPVTAREVAMAGGGRAHVLTVDPGRVAIRYAATVHGTADAPAVTDADRFAFLRPSRYAESDRLIAVAQSEFAGLRPGPELLAAVSSWVGTRLHYVPGSSGPTDGAVETLLRRQGVCRDYAHLVIALLRAMDIPARQAAVYAPGLQPMEFPRRGRGAGRRGLAGGGRHPARPAGQPGPHRHRPGRGRHGIPVHVRRRGGTPGDRGHSRDGRAAAR